MPNVTYFKPVRSKPRYFSMCDAARIAREVVRDRGDTPEEVLACIAEGLGFTHISLSRTRVMEASLLPVLIRGLPVLINKIIVVVQALMKKYGWLIPILKDVYATLKKIADIIDKWIKEPIPEQARVEDVYGEKCKCKRKKSGA